MFQRILSSVRAVPLVLAGLVAAGCGLVDPNITDFDLNIRERSFTIDTAQWGLMGEEVMGEEETFPEIPCDVNQNQCAQAKPMLCSFEDPALCDDWEAQCVKNFCEVTVRVGLAEDVNLLQENEELRTINSQPLVSVSLDEVEFKIEENTLNFASPEITLYVAPLNVMDPTSVEARAIAMVPQVDAGMKHADWQQIELTPAGKADLREFMGDYETTFNILVGAPVTVGRGTEMPMGHAVAKLRVTATAGI